MAEKAQLERAVSMKQLDELRQATVEEKESLARQLMDAQVAVAAREK